MTITCIPCTGVFNASSLRDTHSLLVQLVGPLLELLLASRLAQVVGDSRARVGLVVLKGCSAAAGGLGVFVVNRV